MRSLHIVCLSALLLLACGTKPKVEGPPPPPKPPESPWSWMPPDATTLGRVELDDLRKTQLWPLWSEVEREQRIVSWVDLNKVDHVLFAGTGQKREDASYVAALEGPFADDELRELAARDQVQPEVRGLLTLYRRPEGVWTQITPKLILTCTPDRVDAMVARASQGPGVAIKEAALYRSLAERVKLDDTHFGVIAEDPDGSRRAALERQAVRIGLGSIARDSSRLGVGVQVGAEYHLVAVAEAADGTRAQALEADVRNKLDALSSNFLVRILGVGKVVGRLRPSADGNYVFVRGDIPEEELNELLHRLQGALNLAGGGGLSPGP